MTFDWTFASSVTYMLHGSDTNVAERRGAGLGLGESQAAPGPVVHHPHLAYFSHLRIPAEARAMVL